MGAVFEGEGMIAVFPLELFRDDYVIRVVYRGGHEAKSQHCRRT
jgi:hypothetical protein